MGKKGAWIPGADPIGDLEPVTVKLAQHFRDHWQWAEEMPKVQRSRYLAALAVDFLRGKKDQF